MPTAAHAPTSPPRVLLRALRGGARAFWIETDEELRAFTLVEVVAPEGVPVHTWGLASGCDGDRRGLPLGELLADLAKVRAPALWALLDPTASLGDPLARRRLREFAQARGEGPAVVVISPSPPPADIPELLSLRIPLPDPATLDAQARSVACRLEIRGLTGASAAVDAVAPALARLGVGTDLLTFERLVTAALTEHGANGPAVVAAFTKAKAEVLRSPLLEAATPADPALLGGLDNLKRWLRRRALALDPRARAAAIPDPRGILLVGVQGCGKSLAARASASLLGLPLVRLDPGRLFAGTVGASEANLRAATELAERLAPVVLWIDEIDRGFAGSEGAASDGGTAARVLGGLLTWLQERQRPVFVVATANHLERLPPELLRRGRLDELFFVDLPSPADRRAIAEVHLLRGPERDLGTAPPLADPPAVFLDLAGAADGFSGAELAAALVEARLDAFAEGRPVAAADLERALAATVPLSRARGHEIEALRRWAAGGARPA